MSRLRLLSAFLAVLAAPIILPGQSNGQTTSGQNDATLSRYVQPNANLLVGINWKLVRQSHAAESLEEKLKLQEATASIRSIPGIEFLDDIDRILVSGRSPSQGKEDPELLVAISGHFDLVKIRKTLATFGLKPQLFNSIQVYRPQGVNGQSMAVVLLNAQTILIGDPRSVFATLERRTFPPATPDSNSILARSREMDANYDIWVIGNGLNALAGERMPDLFGIKDLAAEERGFEAGVLVRSGFSCDISLRLDTEEAAKTVASKLDELIKTKAKEKGMEMGLAELEKNLRISSEGSVAKMNLHLTPQELEATAVRIAKAQTLAKAQAQATTASLAARPPILRVVPVPPKPEKQVIRIEGLDDGPRVIPFQQP